MYFSSFDSFQQATDQSKSMIIAVECLNGATLKSSPIPAEALMDVLEEVADAEAGGPIHLWSGPSKELIVIPFSQIAAIRVVFQ